jgi:hypothetical protein
VSLDRPAFAQDGDHIYQRDKVLSDDRADFELLGGNLAKDARRCIGRTGACCPMTRAFQDPVRLRLLPLHQGRPDLARERNPIVGADPRSFPAGHSIAGCSETLVDGAR